MSDMAEEKTADRKDARKSIQAVVQIVTNNYTDNVVCLDLSMGGCKIVVDAVLNPKTLVMLRFYGQRMEGEQHELYDSLQARVQWYRAKDGGKGLIGVQFGTKPNEYHGIPQLLNPDAFKKVKKKLTSTNNSLMGRYVKCYVCGRDEVMQWKMRAKSMLSKSNIFGIPLFTSPMPGKDHCDYNLLRVTICPQCYFASSQLHYFQNAPDEVCPFPVDRFYKRWMETVEERSFFLEQHRGGIFSDIRSQDQALIAYNLAIDTHKLLGTVAEDYQEQRTAISLTLFQAELYMSRGDRNVAEGNLKRAVAELEEIFGNLEKEAILRAALLICRLHLYFKEMKTFGSYMTFLANYNKEGKIDPRSEEGKVLKQCMDLLNKSYEYREELVYDKLKNFHFDF